MSVRACSIMRFLFSVAVLLAIRLRSTEQSNILGLFPHFGYSHFKVFNPILNELAARGHNLTVVTYIASSDRHPNYNELLLNGESLTDVFGVDDHLPSRSLSVMLNEFYDLQRGGQKACEKFYESGYVEEIVRRHSEKPFDLVIVEFFNTDCYLGVPYLLQVPIVGLSSCALMPWHYDRVNLPDFPSYVQTEFVGFREELNWRDRLINYLTTKGTKLLYRLTQVKDNALIKQYLGVDVDVEEIAKTTSLILVNQHYTLSGNRPLSGQVKEIGGVHIPESFQYDSAEISQDIEAFLNKSNDPVLFISFGSMVRSSSMPERKVRAIVDAITGLNVSAIWRWDGDTPPVEQPNILFTNWAPQLSLLCHPKVNIFWGHGGMLGVTEAVHCAKPLLVTPFYGDQFLNGYAVVNRAVGALLLYDDISEQNVVEALQEVMRPRYRNRMDALSKAFRTRETSPLSSAVWWIEHLLSNSLSSDLLRTKATTLNWFIYYSLDAIGILSVVFATCVLCASLIGRLLWRHFNRQPGKAKAS